MKGYKMVKMDGTAYYDSKTMYEVGKEVIAEGPKDGAPCGVGLHISQKPHGPLEYNAQYPWRLLEVAYEEADVLGKDTDKVRVRKLTVIRELRPFRDLGLPNADKFQNVLERIIKIKFEPQNDKSKRRIRGLVRKHIEAMNKFDSKRQVKFKTIKFYTIKEWASVRASVWASVMDSVMASVWASVIQKHQDIIGPEFQILEMGAVLIGITDDGIAHVVMLGKSEIQ